MKTTTKPSRPWTVPRAQEVVAGRFLPLSRTSKMPTFSWGIDPSHCARGSVLAQIPGTICSRCYVVTGFYRTPKVQRTLTARFQGLASPLWPDAMRFLIRVYVGPGEFRWFDAGDLQGVEHLDRIAWIARQTSDVIHWLPTHEPGVVGEWLEEHSCPPNLVIRISADFIEDRPTVETYGFPTSTVHRWKGEPVPAANGNRRLSIECRAYAHGGNCRSCRACFDYRVRNVSYPLH